MLRDKESRIQHQLRGLESVYDAFNTHITAKSKLVLALSGGADSSLLLYMLLGFMQKKGWETKNLTILHMDHCARKTSSQEMSDLFEFCKTLSVCFVGVSYYGSGTTETAFRRARKDFFEQAVFARGNDSVFLSGHHLDDRIETTMMNKERGAGDRGIVNMTLAKTMYIRKYGEVLPYLYLRPYIDCTKQTILEACEEVNIAFIQDQSNFDQSYTKRNAIRAQNKKDSTQERYQQYRSTYMQLENTIELQKETIAITPLQRIWKTVDEYYVVSDFSHMQTLQELLDFMGIYSNITQGFLVEILSFLKKDSGYKYSRGRYFFRSHGMTYIIKGEKEFRNEEVILPFELNESGEIRANKKGDRFKGKPFRKFLGNQKIPFFIRNQMPVLVKGGKIIDTMYHKDLKDGLYI